MTKIRKYFALRLKQLRKIQHQCRSNRSKKAFQIRSYKHHLSRNNLSVTLRKRYTKKLNLVRKSRSNDTQILIVINALLKENENK